MAKRKSATQDVPIAERPIEEVWVEYQSTGTETIRNFFVEKFLPLVKYNAERIHAKLPNEVDVDDLMSAGDLVHSVVSEAEAVLAKNSALA